MSRLQRIWLLGALAFALNGAWAQDNSVPPSNDQEQPSGQQEPAPAYGQENAPPPISENPPLSGLDLPSLEPNAAPLSYLRPGATVSESANSNIGGVPGNTAVNSITRGLGTLTLQRLWSHYDLGLEYVGGAAYYNTQGLGFQSLQQMNLDQKISWKRGQLSLRDSFSYLPEGNFGGAYGALGSQGASGLGSSGLSSFLGGSNLGSLGVSPRILNLSLADISENLTPKSAVTAAGGYAFTHFYGNDVQTGTSFIDSSQITGQVGYDRILTSHTQVGVMYGYQKFDFGVLNTQFHAQVVQAMYGHRISGRMDFLIGAGPQFLNFEAACTVFDVLLGNPHCHINQAGQAVGFIPDSRLSVAGQARLRYRFSKASLSLTYERFETGGSGLFPGAQTDIARVTLARPLTRVWKGAVDFGYSRSGRSLPLSAQQSSTCGGHGQPTCPGVDANTYSYGYAGVQVNRPLGHSFHFFGSYQFNELWFDHSYCAGLPVCNRISNAHSVTGGIDWTPRPIRLD